MLRTNFASARAFSTSASRSAQAFARAQLLGRIGGPLDVAETSNGLRYIKYPLAVQLKKDGPTSWYNIVSFNEQQVDYMNQYVKKGALVHIEANIQQSVFEKDDGSKATNVAFVQNKIDLIMNPRVQEEQTEEE